MRTLLFLFTLIIGFFSMPYIGSAAKVIIDAGHGGSDPGAIGVNGLQEKTVNFDIANRLEELLLGRGYEVHMTRSRDEFLSLQERVEQSRAAGADLFVSVHANAHPSSSIRGTMVLYYDAAHPNPRYPASAEMIELSPESRRLAQAVLASILEQVPNTDRGLVPSSAYVIRNGNVPSILVETAFLSNGQDAQMLSASSIREKYAKGIANGIIQFLPPTFSDIGKHWAYQSIVRLNELEIVNGMNGKYFPDRPLTRAELVSIADRAFGLKKERVAVAEFTGDVTVQHEVYGDRKEAEAEEILFTDLQEQHWSHAVMEEAVRGGILRGYPDGTVRPDAPVTRAEVAVILDRLLGARLPGGSGYVDYKDVDLNYWAFGSIMRLTDGGIVRGVAERTYGPERPVTRGEMATMVDRQLTVRQQQ